jgi:hypothetical protein
MQLQRNRNLYQHRFISHFVVLFVPELNFTLKYMELYSAISSEVSLATLPKSVYNCLKIPLDQ